MEANPNKLKKIVEAFASKGDSPDCLSRSEQVFKIENGVKKVMVNTAKPRCYNNGVGSHRRSINNSSKKPTKTKCKIKNQKSLINNQQSIAKYSSNEEYFYFLINIVIEMKNFQLMKAIRFLVRLLSQNGQLCLEVLTKIVDLGSNKVKPRVETIELEHEMNSRMINIKTEGTYNRFI
jgi:hypothetical protein